MKRSLFVLSILVWFSSLALAAQRPGQLQGLQQQSQFLSDVAHVFEQKKNEIIPLLNEIGALPGALYEVEQSIKALRGASQAELQNFKDIQHLNKIVIYGSSNIPLYTLTLQVIIPSLLFDNVVFKVSSKTKTVYQRLWSLIQKSLSEKYNLSAVQFVFSNSKDGSKDFMMDQIAGREPNLNPADVVVFTGNPANGDDLEIQAREALQQNTKIKAHRMLFLKFGAGMNPVVIDSQIGAPELSKAIDASLEHFLVNSGQDCISPNFSLLPLGQKMQAIRLIKEQVAKMRYGSLQDSYANYSDLTFGTQNTLSALIQFKEKYKAYLVTDPNAAIDLETKRVDPHVFVIPGSLFKQLPLDEFYAPFAVFFTYESEAELKDMIHDPRLSRKAMFASLFGQETSPSFKAIRKELIRTRHLVFENASVFSAEDGNKPFGGFGSDVSTVNYIDKSEGLVSDKQFTRPLLISKEVRKAFRGRQNRILEVSSPLLSANLSQSPLATFSIEELSPLRAAVTLDRKALNGFAEFSRFISTYFVFNRLVSEQQKYFSSKFNPDFLPGRQFVANDGGLLEETNFATTKKVEKQILAGEYSKISVNSSGVIQLHVDVIGNVQLLVEGATPEELNSTLKLISQALSEEKDFSRFSNFKSLSGLNQPLASLKLQQFINTYKRQFSNEALSTVHVDKIIRYFEAHPQFASFLFPIQKWNENPIFDGIEDPAKRQATIEIYMHSTAKYVEELSQVAEKNSGESELRRQIGLWVWGTGNKAFSELIAPWNMQMKSLRSKPKALRCEMLFAL